MPRRAPLIAGVIESLRAFVRSHWPAMRLRTILLSVLLFAAVLPGLSAIFLRVYENTLVRQTEAELIAQSAAVAATAASMWGEGTLVRPTEAERERPDYYRPEPATIDLRSDEILPPRPIAVKAERPAEAAAMAMADRLAPVIDATGRTTLASYAVLDRNGTVVLGAGFGGNWAALPEVQSALKGRPETVLRQSSNYRPRYSMEWLSRASGLRIHHARPVVVNGKVEAVILTSRSPRALFKGIYQDRGKFLIGIVVVLGFLSLVAVMVSRGIARPIERLRRAALDVTRGEGTVPPPPPTAAVEIRDLYEEFGRMAENVERRSRYLRDFAAAVSHEFKTPLAGIQGAVELLQDHEDMEPQQRTRFLNNIDADARRLADLVTRLLDMARADMARPETGVAADLADAVAHVRSAVGDGIEIRPNLPGDLPEVALPPQSLEMVLTILFENSRQVGASRVEISAVAVDDAVVVRVRDNGPGVAQGDVDRIFEPFFTTRRSQGGAGLGLSIAVSLLQASHAELSLEPSETGACFRLSLPAADAKAQRPR
ncbi:HAMP domain-containing sensor histidine kinase [uncultured Brevundimonas sp.]|uniref:sensor histidine kinase n=1 Tax=uncultured Brevundimonas sp. TaxID=213418 RepID=UPI002616E3DC|nr:HAMP domain-containing sensor histidine kinase [uncultured Brevundimonas sp.]